MFLFFYKKFASKDDYIISHARLWFFQLFPSFIKKIVLILKACFTRSPNNDFEKTTLNFRAIIKISKKISINSTHVIDINLIDSILRGTIANSLRNLSMVSCNGGEQI